MKNLKNLKQYKFFFLPVLITVAIIISSLVFLRPKIFDILLAQGKISQNKKTLAIMTQKVAALEGTDETELSSKVEVLLKALPTEKDIANTLIAFKVLTSQTGVNFTGVQVDPGELSTESAQIKKGSEESLPFLSFNLKIEAEQDKIEKFLEKIESSFPLMRVSELTLSAKKESLYEANLKVVSYFLPLPQTLGAPESPFSSITPAEEKVYQKLSGFSQNVPSEGLLEVPTGKVNPFTF